MATQVLQKNGETNMKAHRDQYPEQYIHPLIGKTVQVAHTSPLIIGTVSRIVQTRFGLLAIIEDNSQEAHSIENCEML